ncbi:MAG: hypothetical protein IJQ67_01895 [Bacilli bacterium]|nr:hypothetical protein [Bacilli bacterium]
MMTTDKEIKRYQYEIDTLKHRQKVFLGLGLPLLIIGAILLIGSIIYFILGTMNIVASGANPNQEEAWMYAVTVLVYVFGLTFGILMFIGGLALVILRGTLLQSKISKRQLRINDLEE